MFIDAADLFLLRQLRRGDMLISLPRSFEVLHMRATMNIALLTEGRQKDCFSEKLNYEPQLERVADGDVRGPRSSHPWNNSRITRPGNSRNPFWANAAPGR